MDVFVFACVNLGWFDLSVLVLLVLNLWLYVCVVAFCDFCVGCERFGVCLSWLVCFERACVSL